MNDCSTISTAVPRIKARHQMCNSRSVEHPESADVWCVCRIEYTRVRRREPQASLLNSRVRITGNSKRMADFVENDRIQVSLPIGRPAACCIAGERVDHVALKLP